MAQRLAQGLPARASHTRAVLSSEAVTTRVPSGLNCGGVDPALMRAGARPAAARSGASHTRAVLSPEAVTTRVPSGLNAAERTEPSWRRGAPSGFPAARVPHPRRLVL